MEDKGANGARCGEGSSKFCFRPVEDQKLKFRINHGGSFVTSPIKMYVNGQVYEMEDTVDVDLLNFMDIKNVVKTFGYVEFKLWYQHPKYSFSRGLKPLTNDAELLELIGAAKGYIIVEIYVEHAIDTPVVVEVGDEGPVDGRNDESGESDSVEEIFMEENRAEETRDESDGVEEVFMEETRPEETRPEDTIPEETRAEETVMDDAEGMNDKNERAQNYGAQTDGVDPDGYVSEEDEDYEGMSGEDGYDTEFDDDMDNEEWDWTHELPKETFAGGDEADDNINTTKHVESDDDDESDLHTPAESDDEDSHKRNFPNFKVPESGDTVKFEVGMQFSSKELVRDAVRDNAMETKTNLWFKKNDGIRMIVKCLPECGFYMRISKRSTSQYWQVTSLYGKHSCPRTPGNRQAKTDWLAKKLIPLVRHTSNIKPKGLAAEAFEKWNVTISSFQAYKAKKIVVELLQGAGSEQYAHLRNYAEELRRTNPNSTVIIKCENSEIGPVFERIYVCLEACKAAFAYTCRPLIGLDACFLKGDHGGQLMTVVGKDGNNQMIPIAYVVVESETKDSWKWFVDLLLEDLNSIQARNYAFISDQQKGLVDVIKEIGEHVEHRLCVKHLYGNWKKKYPGAQMKEVLWKAARATTVPDWNRAMQRMKDIKEEAYTDMMKVQASQWTRLAFSTNTQSDLQVNNMCEAFNRSILEIREKPIISLLEGLKHYITVRIVKQRKMLEKAGGDICPKIQQIIEKNKRVAGGWKATWHGDVEMCKFSVSNEIDTYTVNLKEKTCACRKWDLTGIPCAHVVACIWHNQLQPENFVSFYYRKSQALATYSHIILPSNGPSLWPVINAEFINPPVMTMTMTMST